MLLKEGGNAVQVLIDKKLAKNNEKQLVPSSIPATAFSLFFPKKYGIPEKNDKSVVGLIFSTLSSQRLIDPVAPPTYNYGSTRLAAYSFYGNQPGLIDDDELDSAQKAIETKTSFGDLDIDLRFTADKKVIAAAIERIDPSRFACAVSSEVHVAVRFDETHVAQVDVVNAENPERAKIWQRSSFVDLSEGYKGAMLVTLLRVVTRAMDVTEEEVKEVLSIVESNPEAPFAQEINKRLQNGWTINDHAVSYSLKDRGPALVIYLQKGSSVSSVDIGLNPRATYVDLDQLAKTILQDETVDRSDILHFVNLSQYINQHFDRSKKAQIVQDYEQELSRLNLPEDLKKKALNAFVVKPLKECYNKRKELTGPEYKYNFILNEWEEK